jgi:hypothetical protein
MRAGLWACSDLMQVSQADVKLFFESLCGEVRFCTPLLRSCHCLVMFTVIGNSVCNIKGSFISFKMRCNLIWLLWNVQVARLRLLGDYHHSTRIAFVEFVMVRRSSLVVVGGRSGCCQIKCWWQLVLHSYMEQCIVNRVESDHQMK